MLGRRMAEDGKREGCLRDEDVAGLDLEGRAGGIGVALVVAGDDGAAAPPFQACAEPSTCPAGRNQSVTPPMRRSP